jgi:deoxyribodipyrimidine photo-lyase
MPRPNANRRGVETLSDIQPERVQTLNDAEDRRGKFVLYWMQQSQRADCNHALEYAIDEANARELPVVAVFGITDDFPGANLRHYAFMLEGLKRSQQALKQRKIKLVVRHRSPEEAALELVADAALLVCDRGYLRVQKVWRDRVAERAPCRVVQVESDVVVPVETASDKEEYAARTIRPKIHRHLERFLVPLRLRTPKRSSLRMRFETFDLGDTENALRRLDIDRSVPPSPLFAGGTDRAEELLDTFIEEKLRSYDADRNDPSLDIQSHLSPYLHFGQISPLRVALRVADSGATQGNVDAFLEELLVRRELSMNFVHFCDDYDQFVGIPDWAKETLDEHRPDPRDPTYSPEQFEQAETHDKYWNAAQREMVAGGKMHNYMRMYWGKKIIEWSRTPEDAFRTALALNNRYELDGRDANGFTGVAWCFGKHDRAWTERPILGKLRWMSAGGLKRKFDMGGYLERVAERTG